MNDQDKANYLIRFVNWYKQFGDEEAPDIQDVYRFMETQR